MYPILIIFYISLVGVVSMILFKRKEIKTASPSLVSRVCYRYDPKVQSIFDSIANFFSYINRHTFIWLAQMAAYYALRYARSIYFKIRSAAYENPHTRKVIDMVNGRGEVHKHGASFYLKRISNQDW